MPGCFQFANQLVKGPVDYYLSDYAHFNVRFYIMCVLEDTSYCRLIQCKIKWLLPNKIMSVGLNSVYCNQFNINLFQQNIGNMAGVF